MQSALTNPPSSRIEGELKRLGALLSRGEFAQARQDAETLHAEVPENRDVLSWLAVSQRCLKRIPEALTTLALLEGHDPPFSRCFRERATCTMESTPARP